ncbi:MAG: 30S ribosomal protein S3 [Planctomycetes bacterium]|nr:30S ribosomal protein S3 [Planctomycetota bacterium]
MGQKVHPIGFRVGITENWRSRWYAGKKEFGKFLLEDIKIRKFIEDRYKSASISKVEIERTSEAVNVFIHTARPGVLLGRKGANIDKLKESLEEITKTVVYLYVRDIKRPELDAMLVASELAQALQKRAAFRKAVKKAVQGTMQAGAKGVKVEVSGRLGGAEMARRETARDGRIPLQTLRANVDYGFTEAHTTYGAIGIKVWIYKGDFSVGETGAKSARRAGTGAPTPGAATS